MTSVLKIFRSSLRLFPATPLKARFLAQLSFVPVVYCSSTDLKKIEFQNHELSHQALLQQASSSAVNSATQLLTQTLVAIVHVSEKYMEALKDTLSLLEESKKYPENSVIQQQLNDYMLETRSASDSFKKELMDYYSLLESVEKVVMSVTEASFLVGAEVISSTLSERLYSAQQQVEKIKAAISILEKECLYLHHAVIVEPTLGDR